MIVVDTLKQRVGRIVDKLQAVLGYIELGTYDKARQSAIEASQEATELAKTVSGMSVMIPPSDVKAIVVDTPVSVLPIEKAAEIPKLTEAERDELVGLENTGKIIIIPKKPPTRETL